MSGEAAAIQERGNWKLRAIDRYAGIPLVVLLGLTHRKARRPPDSVRSIGLLVTTAIGDAILNSAAVACLRHRYPEARIKAFCSAGNLAIARMMGGVDEVVSVPVTRPLEAIRTIRSHGPLDVWIDFGPWPRINAVFTRFARARFKIGFDSPGQLRHFVYDSAVRHDLGRHEVENYLALLAPLGVEGTGRPHIRAGTLDLSGPTAAIHVFPGGSRHYLKSWPDNNWLKLFERLVAEGYAIRLTGGPADRSRLEALVSRSRVRQGIRIEAGALSLAETGALIRSADVTISVDTGILHLASALGADLVALHGPTSPKRWGALNANAVSLESGLPCSPCVSIGYEKGCGVNRCMQAISPEAVMDAVHALRNARPGGPGARHG